MDYIDISQDVFNCSVFPGDNPPEREILESIKEGGICNLTGLSMCAHNGTHIDAPYHFFDGGKCIDDIDLDTFIGRCFVTFASGPLTAQKAEEIVSRVKKADKEAARRILIGGDMYVTLEAAKVFSREGLVLLGNESQTVGPIEAPADVHRELLGRGVALLEGIRLYGVDEGIYLLSTAPLKLGGSDGAPCRAILIKVAFYAKVE